MTVSDLIRELRKLVLQNPDVADYPLKIEEYDDHDGEDYLWTLGEVKVDAKREFVTFL